MLSIEELTLPAVLYNKVVLKNVANFMAKHLQHFFIIKLLTLTCDLRLHRCCECCKIFQRSRFYKTRLGDSFENRYNPDKIKSVIINNK